MRRKTLNFTAVTYPDADSDWLVAHNPETGTTTQGKKSWNRSTHER